MPLRLIVSLLLPLTLLLSGCGGSNGADKTLQSTRSFAMGFTPWPYDATPEAVSDVYTKIGIHGDIIAHHLDSGIPWQEALDGTPYPDAVESEITARLANTPAGHRIYLAVSPFNGARDALAGYWNDAGTGQPLNPPWDGLDFNNTDVQTAYIHFAADLISRFKPAYFNFGIEASELALKNPARFARYLDFAAKVSAALKTTFPEVKLMISVALKSPGSADATTINTALPPLIEYVDIVGASVYPYIFFNHADKGDPANLPVDWLSQLQPLAGTKTIAVAETGWIAERLSIPAYGVDVLATPADQKAFVQTLFVQAEALKAAFIIWFAIVDFDALWKGALGEDPVAQIWRDTGLYDGNISARPALGRWDEELNKTLR